MCSQAAVHLRLEAPGAIRPQAKQRRKQHGSEVVAAEARGRVPACGSALVICTSGKRASAARERQKRCGLSLNTAAGGIAQSPGISPAEGEAIEALGAR